MIDKQMHVIPIGQLRSPFKEKFGLPRQAGLIQYANASIEFYPPYNEATAFSGLENFSHIWLTFHFHLNDHRKWRPLIRPPRLGGNEKIGVFASRASYRPNGIGMSAVKLLKVHIESGKASLEITCPDLLDGTPILDIRPYIAYSDRIQDTHCSFAQQPPEQTLAVKFSAQGLTDLKKLEGKRYGNLKRLIEETIGYDPRPAYKTQNDPRQYGIRLYDLNIRWHVNNNIAEVLTVQTE